MCLAAGKLFGASRLHVTVTFKVPAKISATGMGFSGNRWWLCHVQTFGVVNSHRRCHPLFWNQILRSLHLGLSSADLNTVYICDICRRICCERYYANWLTVIFLNRTVSWMHCIVSIDSVSCKLRGTGLDFVSKWAATVEFGIKCSFVRLVLVTAAAYNTLVPNLG